MRILRDSRLKVASPTMCLCRNGTAAVQEWCNATLINARVRRDTHPHLQEPRRRPAKSNIITNSSDARVLPAESHRGRQARELFSRRRALSAATIHMNEPMFASERCSCQSPLETRGAIMFHRKKVKKT